MLRRIASEAADHAGLVVVAQIDGRPAVAGRSVQFGEHLLDRQQAIVDSGIRCVGLGRLAQVGNLERVKHVQLSPRRLDETVQVRRLDARAFADGHYGIPARDLLVYFP